MMKSNLVDALRQSQGKDKDEDSRSTLSDSGSFDTTQTEFGPTANDEDVLGIDSPAEDLELLNTGVFTETGILEQSGVFTNEELDSLGDDGLPMRSMTEVSTSVVAANARRTIAPTPEGMVAPAMARLAPIICTALAISAATVWAGYRYFAAIDTGHNVGASQGFSGIEGNRGEVENTVPVSGAGRFPFIDVSAEVDAGDSSE